MQAYFYGLTMTFTKGPCMLTASFYVSMTASLIVDSLASLPLQGIR
jgi:hypothetical protein